MADYILVLESDEMLVDLLNIIVKPKGIKTLRVENQIDARRALIKKVPLMIVAANELDDKEGAGFELAASLSEHPTFKDIPLIVFFDNVAAEDLTQAMEMKIGVMPYAVDSKVLKHTIYRLISNNDPNLNCFSVVEAVKIENQTTGLDEIVEVKVQREINLEDGVGQYLEQKTGSLGKIVKDAENEIKITIYEEPTKPQRKATLFGLNLFRSSKGENVTAQSISDEVDMAHRNALKSFGVDSEDDLEWKEKIDFAKVILAKIFHNLKTSDLLRLIEKNEVPSIVLKIAKSVCEAEELSLASEEDNVSGV